MTHEHPFDGDVTSPEEFERALGGLLVTALRNDVDPRGAWEYRVDGVHPDWEILFAELNAGTVSD